MTRSASHHRPGRPLSALGQSTRRHYRNGSHYRHPYLDDAKRRPARDATIGTRRRRRARGSRRFTGCPRGPACMDADPTRISPATRPASGWTAYAGGAQWVGLRVTTRSHFRRARPLSAHVSYDVEPLSARQAIIGTRARQREPPPVSAQTTAKPLSACAVRIEDATGPDCPGRGGVVPPDAVRPTSVRPLESTKGESKMRRAQRAHPDVMTERCPVGAVINTYLTLNLAHGLNTLTGLGPSRRGGKRHTAETARKNATLLRQPVTLHTPHC